MATLSNIGIPVTSVTYSATAPKVHGTVISVWGDECMGPDLQRGTFGVSAGWPAANQALFFPFEAYEAFTVVNGFIGWGATTGSNNFDVGIYDIAGNRLASTGATASTATTNDLQKFSLSYALTRGMYYMAISADSTAFTPYRCNTFDNRATAGLGCKQMLSAYPLPATATLTEVAVDYIPILGLSRSSAI